MPNLEPIYVLTQTCAIFSGLRGFKGVYSRGSQDAKSRLTEPEQLTGVASGILV